MNKFSLPDDSAEIASRIKAELEASGLKLDTDLRSLFSTDVPAADLAAGPHPSVGLELPQSRVGAFRTRLSATLKNEPSSK